MSGGSASDDRAVLGQEDPVMARIDERLVRSTRFEALPVGKQPGVGPGFLPQPFYGGRHDGVVDNRVDRLRSTQRESRISRRLRVARRHPAAAASQT